MLVVIAWLNVIAIVSPGSSLPAAPPFAATTELATTPSCAAAVGFEFTLVHDADEVALDLVAGVLRHALHDIDLAILLAAGGLEQRGAYRHARY